MKQSGVLKKMYNQYTFADHLWNRKNHPDAQDFIELTDLCILIGDCYYVRQPNSDNWIEHRTQTRARQDFANKWYGHTLRSGRVITDEITDIYFTGEEDMGQVGTKKTIKQYIGSCPVVQHTMVIPYGPKFLTYNKNTYLNVWADEMLPASSSEENVNQALSLLEMIYRSLCNGDVLSEDKLEESQQLLTQIVTNEYTNMDFRFVMNWLAAIYQRPGINLQTNLWFCGEQNGVGKGTLVEVMRALLGRSYVTTMNQVEIEQGWNDHLMGCMLIEVNEFDTSGKMTRAAWNKWIKQHCNEPTIGIRKRNQTAKQVLNIGNYIFTTNDEDPVGLDKTDRRNHMIKTTDDRYWKEYASVVRTQYVDRDLETIAAGFGWILEQVQVDDKFISSAFVNDLKATIIAAGNDEIERWLREDPLIDKDIWRNASDFYEKFKTWMNQYNPGQRIPTMTAWGRRMSKCADLAVNKRRTDSGTQYFVGSRIPKLEKVDRDLVARDVGSITGITVSVPNYDQEIPTPTAMNHTPMQKMRLALQRLED